MRGMGMAFGHMNGVLALIALALGYIICTITQKEKDLLKTIGYIIGVVIITTSSLIIIAKVLFTAKMYMKMCSMQGSVMMPMPAESIPKK